MPSLLLQDPAIRRALVAHVKRRVPPREVEDLVQSTLVDALASAGPPEEADAYRRWLFGIAQHKVADFHRRGRRDVVGIQDDVAALEPHDPTRAPDPRDPEQVDLLRWAERELPANDDSPATLRAMLREADGEKLAEIASDERIPAPMLRQRVSRLRRHFRSRWAIQVSALAALGIVIVTLIAIGSHLPKPHPPPIGVEPPPALERARSLRRKALNDCAEKRFEPCIEQLDRARDLDPPGDSEPEVQRARGRAARP